MNLNCCQKTLSLVRAGWLSLLLMLPLGLTAQPGPPPGYGGPMPQRGGSPSGPGRGEGPPRMSYPPSSSRMSGPGRGAPQMPGDARSGQFMGLPPSRSVGPPRQPGNSGMGVRDEPQSRIPSSRFGSIPDGAGIRPGPMGPPSGGRPGGPDRSMPQPPDTSRMQQALRHGDYATIGKESAGIRNRTENLERMVPDMPVQDRIQVPLINHMYRQGAALMDEGRSKQDDTKIRMGIQQINQANEKLNRLQDGSGSGRSSSGPRER